MEKSYSLDTPASTVMQDIQEALTASADVVPREEVWPSRQVSCPIPPGSMVTARFPVIDANGVGYEEVEAQYLGHYQESK